MEHRAGLGWRTVEQRNANANCQMQVPRHTYLPLLIPEIKENMVELALDDSILSGLDEKDWWFEEEPPSAEEGEVFAGQGVCKWYV